MLAFQPIRIALHQSGIIQKKQQHLNMQRLKFVFPTLLLLLVIVSGCADKTTRSFLANTPVYTPTETWRAQAFTFEATRALKTPGKIYLYNNLLLVNEFLEGVHFYDNSNPASPIELGFLPVHANQDLAVRNNILYVDSYTDLLSFDISDPRHPNFLTRLNNIFAFNNYVFMEDFDPNYPMVEIDPNQGVVTGWIVEETTTEVVNYGRGGMMEDMLMSNSGGAGPLANSNFANGNGLGGSTARFTIFEQYLYTLENFELGVFDIQDGLVHLRDIGLTMSSETLFPADGYLYIGTTTGMLIYNLSNAASPTFVSSYAHMTSCDPVVVQGDKAFVTLRSGNFCAGNVNTLQVIDLSDMSQPTLLYDFPMTNPNGLGVDANTLFLCDGADGLKVFDKTDLSTINQHLISQFSGITATDVIPNNQVLLMTSAEGIYQYSYADLQNITQLSVIPVQH